MNECTSSWLRPNVNPDLFEPSDTRQVLAVNKEGLTVLEV